MPNPKIELKVGRQVFLEEFFATKTYAGLLEGKPNASINADILRTRFEEAKRIWPTEPNVLLGLGWYTAHVGDELPPVTCIGQFISYSPSSDLEKMGSSLVVIWFQSEMTTALEGNNAVWIKELDWTTLARDFDW